MNKLPAGWIWVKHLHSGEVISIYKANFPLEFMKNDFEILEVKNEDDEVVIPEPTEFKEAVDVPKYPQIKTELKKLGVMIPKGATKEELEILWRESI